jgi:hypothetical protein
MNTSEITTSEITTTEQFYFEIAEQENQKKDRIIAEMTEELHELREYVLHQRRQTIARKLAIKDMTDMVEEIIALYPTFIENDVSCAHLARVKGYEYANDIVNYIDKFRSGEKALQFIHSELGGIVIETATYDLHAHWGDTRLINYASTSSMCGFKSNSRHVHHPHIYLYSAMSNIILEPLRLGHCTRNASGPGGVYYYSTIKRENMDGIFYKSNEEHAKIWEWKKIFSKRLVASLLTYVDTLLQDI